MVLLQPPTYILLELYIILISLIIYKPSTLIIFPQTFSMQLGASTSLFCLSQCAIPFCTPLAGWGVAALYTKGSVIWPGFGIFNVWIYGFEKTMYICYSTLGHYHTRWWYWSKKHVYIWNNRLYSIGA